jgi:hypothetical protein
MNPIPRIHAVPNVAAVMAKFVLVRYSFDSFDSFMFVCLADTTEIEQTFGRALKR